MIIVCQNYTSTPHVIHKPLPLRARAVILSLVCGPRGLNPITRGVAQRTKDATEARSGPRGSLLHSETTIPAKIPKLPRRTKQTSRRPSAVLPRVRSIRNETTITTFHWFLAPSLQAGDQCFWHHVNLQTTQFRPALDRAFRPVLRPTGTRRQLY